MRSFLPQAKRGRSCFTLLEVICTLAIVALIMTALAGLMRSTVRAMEAARDRMRGERLRYGVGRILRDDLANVMCIPTGDEFAFTARQADPDRGGVVLEFATTHSLARRGPRTWGAPCQVDYVLRPSPDIAGCYELIRRERPCTFGSPRNSGKPLEEMLTEEVSYWRIECYDGTEWRKEWRRLRLPTALRVDFAIGPAKDALLRAETLYFAPLVNPDLDPTPKLGEGS